MISKEIICPECKTNILINNYDFKINLYECKNNHKFNNLLLNEFYETKKLTKMKLNVVNAKKLLKNILYVIPAIKIYVYFVNQLMIKTI